jgi:murein DD-endopeptidase MepM/ murein hydrolase activator NlpD
MFNPYAGWNITGTNDEHHARGSLGGTDFEARVGTAIVSPGDGVVNLANNLGKGSGGKMVGVNHGGGIVSEQYHLSSIAVRYGEHVTAGQLLGYSGRSGYGKPNWYDPHIHAHIIERGTRRGWAEWFADNTGSLTPVKLDTQPLEEDEMAETLEIERIVDGTGKEIGQALRVGTRAFVGIATSNDVKILERYIENSPKAVYLAVERDRINSYLRGVTP